MINLSFFCICFYSDKKNEKKINGLSLKNIVLVIKRTLCGLIFLMIKFSVARQLSIKSQNVLKRMCINPFLFYHHKLEIIIAILKHNYQQKNSIAVARILILPQSHH